MMNTRSLISILIATLIIASSCNLDDPTKALNSDEVISLHVVNGDLKEDTTLLTVTADSLASRLIQVRLGEKTDGDQVVTLQTTAGVLTRVGEKPGTSSGGTLVLTAGDRVLMAQLHALDKPVGQVTVSATASNVTNVLQFNFVPSYPSQIYIHPTEVSVLKTEDVTITLQMQANTGKISEGLYVMVTDSVVNEVVLNHPAFIAIKNRAASFTVKNVNARVATIYLRVKVPVADKKYTSKEIKIDYQ
jgi:hypothetical protein